jgi:hypothetical protein
VTVKTLTEVTEVTVAIEDTAIEDTATDAVDKSNRAARCGV